MRLIHISQPNPMLCKDVFVSVSGFAFYDRLDTQSRPLTGGTAHQGVLLDRVGKKIENRSDP